MAQRETVPLHRSEGSGCGNAQGRGEPHGWGYGRGTGATEEDGRGRVFGSGQSWGHAWGTRPIGNGAGGARGRGENGAVSGNGSEIDSLHNGLIEQREGSKYLLRSLAK